MGSVWNTVPAGLYSLTALVTDALGRHAISSTLTVIVTNGATTSTQAYYIHTDHLDTPRQITNTAGQVVWQWDNTDPFGANIPNENPSGLGPFTYNPRFAGQYFDKETNTHYNINRDYDPSIGRYIQSDPIGLEGGSFSTYTYVDENPLMFVDPLGLDFTINLYPRASGFGHVGGGVNSSNTTGFYPAAGSSTWDVATGQAVPGVMLPDTRIPESTITIPTTPAQDKAIQEVIDARKRNPGKYDLNDRNCTTTVRDELRAANIDTPETILPKTLMRNLQNKYGRTRK